MEPVSNDGDTNRPRPAVRNRVGVPRGLPEAKAWRPAAGPAGRRTQTALAVLAVLGVGLGYGTLADPTSAPRIGAVAATSTPVRSSTLVCSTLTGAADATVAALAPAGTTASAADTATVTAIDGKTPVSTLTQTGALSVVKGLSGSPDILGQDSAPVIGRATGVYARGYTLTETLASGGAGSGHGLASTACTAPDTDFWYIGAADSARPISKLNLVNADPAAAQVNLTAYNAGGPVPNSVMQTDQGLLVPAGAQYTQPIDLTAFPGAGPVAVHVTATAGRVTAALLDADGGTSGRDFITAQKPAAHLLIPGIPAPLPGMKLQLALLAPATDTDVTLHWVGSTTISPMVTVHHMTAGTLQVVDLSSVPVNGEAAALQIDSSGAPVIAGIKVSDGADDAFLSPVGPLAGEALVADDASGSVVELTNTGGRDAQVQVETVTTGAPTPQSVTVPAHSTKAVPLTAPSGAASFAVSVTPLGGAQSVYAARIMTGPGGLLTIQPMSTALEFVQVPAVHDDLSAVVPQ